MKSIYFLSLNFMGFIPYAYGLLRAYAEQSRLVADNYRWIEPFWKMDPLGSIVERIIDPDILLGSCYIWNHNHHDQIARMVKEKYPQCKIIFGGPHIPNLSDSYFSVHPHVDLLVHGEGEVPLTRLLLEFLNNKPDLRDVPDISINEALRAVKTPTGPRLPKELPIPSPFLTGLLDNIIKSNPNMLGLWETNRGCPYSCGFCSWGVNALNKIKLHDLDKIRCEIEFMSRHGTKELYICDANFGLLKRDLEIARLLVESKKKYGYPMGVRINFAKDSNDNVFEISRLLYENEMLWGTTLTMQSMNGSVLKAISRPPAQLGKYRELKRRYQEIGIPTYTELILGLPLETRDSFINGLCDLFKVGIHEDIRVFELSMLPNAPLSQEPMREKYGFKSKFKPIHMKKQDHATEFVEIVFETNTMPYEDWAYCLYFAEAIQALHNGGYTRFMARYFDDNHILSYRDFYDNLLQFALENPGESFSAFKRLRRLIDNFYYDPEMPHVHRILCQPDIMTFLRSYNPTRKGWRLFTFIWLWVSERLEDFYQNLLGYLEESHVNLDKKILDLIQYQKDLMLTLDYDPNLGKVVHYQYDWFEYFFEGGTLKERPTTLHYTDTHMGASHRYPLAKNDRRKFLNAALGQAYPYSKFRHFFHQPDVTKRL